MMAIRFEKVARDRADYEALAQEYLQNGWNVEFIERKGRMKEVSEA